MQDDFANPWAHASRIITIMLKSYLIDLEQTEGWVLLMKTTANRWKHAFAGLYTWTATLYFGAVLLDIVYAHLASRTFQAFETAGIFSEVADFLLIIGGLTLVTAVGAITAAWRSEPARNLFIASLVCLSLPFLLYPLIAAAQASLEINLGTWVRLVTSALPSILAFFGLGKLDSSAA